MDRFDASQDGVAGDGLVRKAEAIALGDDDGAGAIGHAVGDEASVALEDDHVVFANGFVLSRDFEHVAGAHAGEHAAAGYREARGSEAGQDFGGEVQLEIGYLHACASLAQAVSRLALACAEGWVRFVIPPGTR